MADEAKGAVGATDETAPGQETTVNNSGADNAVKAKTTPAPASQPAEDMPSKEELEAYRKWKEDQKTAEERRTAELGKEQRKRAEAEQRALDAEAKVACLMAGVDPKYVDDAMILAQHLVTDAVSIDDAIKQVVSKYPSFKGETRTVTVTTGKKTQASPQVNDDEMVKKIMGLS